MPILSVIVPVYKVEEYLPQCIDSILAQTFSDLELILVDDGSPDNSGKICDDYAARNSNIRVIHQKNGGHTSARKAGMRIAEGKYISLIDSDDFLEPDMYERMIRRAREHQADMVVIGHVMDLPGQTLACENALASGVYREKDLEKLRSGAIFCVPEGKSGINGAMWCKLFLREKAQETFLNQEEVLRVGEDMLFSYRMLLNAGCVVIENENHGYHYRIRESSITQTYYKDYFRDINLLYDQLKMLSQRDESTGAMEALANYYIYQYVDGVYRQLGRGNQAGTREKCQNTRLLAKEPRLQECLRHVDLKQLPVKVRRTVRLLGEGCPNLFLAYHVVSAAASKMKRILK